MANIVTWQGGAVRKNLFERLRDAAQYRKQFEDIWTLNEVALYDTNNQEESQLDNSGANGIERVKINYLARNAQFIHAQLSANPPVVAPKPLTNDPEDRRAADAADRLQKYALREYRMQENIDLKTLNVVTYGTGFTKTRWNQDLGDPIEVDPETGKMLMEGNFEIGIPDVRAMFIDPDANRWTDVRYVFERLTLPYEHACYLFPEAEEKLLKIRIKDSERQNGPEGMSDNGYLSRRLYDVVEVYEYWEKGLPENGFLGRYCICTVEGEPLIPLTANPERYSAITKTSRKTKLKVPTAVLPYHCMTYIDVPNQVYGKSFVEYAAPIQRKLNNVDSLTYDILKAHGIPRIIHPKSTILTGMTDRTWDVVEYEGTIPPNYMEPMPMPSIIPQIRNDYTQGIDALSGINENMLGNQSREQSGASMQYATNQGNVIRRRVFNKYVQVVEDIYNSYLMIVAKNWDIARTIHVIGKEKAFEVSDIKGADIQGGFALVSEYGTNLSLDPTMRREEIMTMMPAFEKAGVEPRNILKMMRLNELDHLYDMLELAGDRQRELFEEMITTNLYIAPEELQDHKNMLTYAYYFLMTTEYKYLEGDAKALIKRHVLERERLAAQGAAAQATMQGPGSPGALPNAEGIVPPPVPGPVAPA